MNAVEILTAARTRLSNPVNWTTGRLFRERAIAQDGFCFCSMGAVMKEGGAFTKDQLTNTLHPVRVPGVEVSPGNTDLGVYTTEGSIPTEKSVTARLYRLLEEAGCHAKTTRTAIAYLNAAAKQATNNIWERPYELNDAYGHAKVLQMFDLAIRNAKRRHINGKRLASQKVVA